MIKNYLTRYINSVDYSTNDQVWLKLKCIQSVIFGLCYIPPRDSEYFTHRAFSAIQEKLQNDDDKCIIKGDMNARFGEYVRELPTLSDTPSAHLYEYPAIVDNILAPNNNAYVLSTMCVDNKLLVLNNLMTPARHYRGDDVP